MQAMDASEKQHLALFPRMGISQWQAQPAVRHFPFQRHALTLCFCPSLSLLAIVFGTYTLNL